MEKKTLQKLLFRQGVETSPDFFDAPKREEIRIFWDGIISLVFGPHVLLCEVDSVQNALYASYIKETRSRALQLQSSDHPFVDSSAHSWSIEELLPDRGSRQLQALAIARIFQCLRHFGKLFGIRNISVQLVARPPTHALIMFGNAIVNWMRFQEQTLNEEMAEWNNVVNKAEMVKAKRTERDEFRSAVRNIKEQVEQQLPQKQQLEWAVEEMKSEVCALHNDFNQVKAQEVKVTTRYLEQKGEQEKRAAKNHRLRLEIASMKERIVESPEQIVEALKSLTAKVEFEQTAAKHESRMLPINQQHSRVAEDLGKRYELLWSFVEERARIVRENDKLKQQIDVQRKRVSSKGTQMNEYMTQERQRRADLVSTQKSLEKARAQKIEYEKMMQMKEEEAVKSTTERKHTEEANERIRREGEENLETTRSIAEETRKSEAAAAALIQEYLEASREEDAALSRRVEGIVERYSGENLQSNDVMQQILNDDVAKNFVVKSASMRMYTPATQLGVTRNNTEAAKPNASTSAQFINRAGEGLRGRENDESESETCRALGRQFKQMTLKDKVNENRKSEGK